MDRKDKKNIKFYKYFIDIKNDEDLSSLKNIKNNEKPNVDSEKTKVYLFNGEFFCRRFYGMDIQSGDSDDYGQKVVNIKKDLKIEDNPKKKTQIELHGESFLLIDKDNKTIYLSNSKHRELAENRLSEATKHTVSIKQILDRKNFESTLKTISELNFTLTKDSDLYLPHEKKPTLKERINQDINDYYADSIKVRFQYKQRLVDKRKDLFKKIRGVMNDKAYKYLKIVGTNNDGLESIFKSGTIASTIELEIQKSHYRYKDILNKLIEKIKNMENDQSK